jgi:uncharacterized lipoprotein YehR (DUF1307 family)
MNMLRKMVLVAGALALAMPLVACHEHKTERKVTVEGPNSKKEITVETTEKHHHDD